MEKGDDSVKRKLQMFEMYQHPEYRPLNRDKYEELRRDFRREITNQIIIGMDFQDRFFTDIVKMMLLKVLNDGRLNSDRIKDAFELLELYCLNLIHYSWKSEIRKLKRYTGIYRTKLLEVVPDVDNFITDIGYDLLRSADVFHLKRHVSRALLNQMAFDCFVAQKQCEFLEIVAIRVRKTQPDIGFLKIGQCIETLEGDEQYCSKLIEQFELKRNVNNATNSNTQSDMPSLITIQNKNMEDFDGDNLYS